MNHGGVVVGIVASAGLAAGGECAAPGCAAVGPGVVGFEVVHGCWGDEQGRLTGGRFLVPSDGVDFKGVAGVQARGDGDNRVDLVIVGDGYRASEMGLFHLHADRIADDFFAYEPFVRYRPYFRVTKVEVVSEDSGVDNDPSQGVSRDTAMDMAFWCGGTERLLCVNVGDAYAYATAGAPDVDQVLAIANSTKYGGAGYSSSNLGTASGGNASAVQIAIHEMGHSLGDLADEYTYGGPSNYTGPEPSAANLSRYDAEDQLQFERKWFRWLGASLPGFDGTVSTFEGGGYSETGIYRPSSNSMMRSLNRPFNLPSAERLIREFYREVSPIDAGPEDGAEFDATETISIVPMQPIGTPLSVSWSVNGVPVAGAAGAWDLDLSSLGLGAGEHTVEVRVVDETPWVLDPAIRSAFLTESRVYKVSGCGSSVDFNDDGVLDLRDIMWFADAFLSGDLDADLSAPFGILDLGDLTAFVGLFLGGCL